MDIKGYIFSLVVSFALGYFAYPVVFVKDGPKVKTFVESVTVSGPSGKVSLDIDVREVKPKEVPSSVRMREAVQLKQIDGEMSITLEKGASAEVESYKDGFLKIKDPKGNFLGLVPWEKTNFTEGVGLKRIEELMGDSEAEIKAKKLEAENARLEAARAAAEARAAEKDDEEEEEMEEEESEEKTSGTGPLSKEVSAEEVISLMKESVEKKIVSEFTVDGVTDWEAGEKETLSDVEYQTGFATYEKETIFGKQPVVGKCLIRDGVVKKWVYAKTGADIP